MTKDLVAFVCFVAIAAGIYIGDKPVRNTEEVNMAMHRLEHRLSLWEAQLDSLIGDKPVR